MTTATSRTTRPTTLWRTPPTQAPTSETTERQAETIPGGVRPCDERIAAIRQRQAHRQSRRTGPTR